jgi:hypothetical protein
MANVVWKWPLAISGGVQELTVPAGTQFLHVDFQGNNLCLWGLCDPSEPSVVRQIKVLLTGQDDDGAASSDFVGTAQAVLKYRYATERVVVHVFEIKP